MRFIKDQFSKIVIALLVALIAAYWNPLADFFQGIINLLSNYRESYYVRVLWWAIPSLFLVHFLWGYFLGEVVNTLLDKFRQKNKTNKKDQDKRN